MDRRTTPRWRRLPVLLGLALLIGYFGMCFHLALGRHAAPSWARGHPFFWGWGGWQMFTVLDVRATALQGEALVDGEWERIRMQKLFPTIWESGPRYQRNTFLKSPSRMRVLAASTCLRHPDAPARVRFTKVQWRKRLGQRSRPDRKAKRTEMLEWDCDKSVRLPGGRTLSPRDD